MLRGIHLLLELQRVRSNQSDHPREAGTKRKADEETINNILLDGSGATAKILCRYERNRPGSCKRGAKCTFQHDTDTTKHPNKKVRFDTSTASDKKASKQSPLPGKHGKGKGPSKPK